MKLKITALKNVTIRAYVSSQTLRRVGSDVVMVPSEKETWVEIEAGNSEFTGMVLGAHPSCLPDRGATRISGVPMVILPSYNQETLPQDFFGLFRMELAG